MLTLITLCLLWVWISQCFLLCNICSHLNLLEVVLDKIDDSKSCALPEELPTGNHLCCVEAVDVMFLAKEFQKCALANSDMNEINKNYKILMLLLGLLNALSVQSSNLRLFQQCSQLLESAAGELSKPVRSTVYTVYGVLNRANITALCTFYHNKDIRVWLEICWYKLIRQLESWNSQIWILFTTCRWFP